VPATIYPLERLFGDLTVKIVEIRIDGERMPNHFVDAELQVVNVYSTERRNWREADLDITVEAPLQELRAKSIDDDRTHSLLRINCDSTNLRSTELAEFRAGVAQATITLRRELFDERATLECFIVVDGPDGVARILKEAAPWTVVFAGPRMRQVSAAKRRGQPREFVLVQWANFSDAQIAGGELRPFAREAYYVDVGANPPVLYLNRELENYEVLLSERRGASRAEQALRDLEFRRLSLGVWIALIQQALADLQHDDDLGEITYPYGWKLSVLERLLPRLFPGESFEVSARKVVALRRDDGGSAYLFGRLQIAINELIDTSAVLRKHLSALANLE